MKYFTFLKQFIPKDFLSKDFLFKELPKPLGRWRTEHCRSQMNKKIDLSNEDHCGPCGQYALDKQKIEKK
jgi:hypothetical protein